MYERVINQNKNTNICLFTKIYEMMIDKKSIDAFGKIKNKQNININLEMFLKNFDKNYQEKIKYILNKNCYIPQEIINAKNLINMCKEKGTP